MTQFPALQYQCMDEVEVDTNGPMPPFILSTSTTVQHPHCRHSFKAQHLMQSGVNYADKVEFRCGEDNGNIANAAAVSEITYPQNRGQTHF